MITTGLLIALVLLGIVNLYLAAGGKNDSREEIRKKLAKTEAELARIDMLIRDEFGRNRNENQTSFKENREELSRSFKLLGETLSETVAGLAGAQRNQFDAYSNRLKDFNELQRQKFDDLLRSQEHVRQETEAKLKEIRETVEGRLSAIREDTNKRLEEMRTVVDEKLQESVEKRFNESFKLINERLEAVHKGLGEMQSLAVGVGDLKKALTNVKTRGAFGEAQLGAILEQFLSPEQYIKNEHPDDDRKVVEYAIRLPGKNGDGEPVLLPVDSKFPLEDYQRLAEAYENEIEKVEVCRKVFENSVKKCAKDICEKYIKPPKTTDFAILFVPTEGLYAEILRRPGFMETLQQEFRVIVVGPTNLVALLNSLQMGFRTLAIEKRSSEVWQILAAVKTEFGKFNKVLLSVKKNLEGGIKNIDEAVGARTNVMMSKLKAIDKLPEEESLALLGEAIEIGADEPAADPDNGRAGS